MGHQDLDAATVEICRAVVDSGLKVHKVLGPGLLGSTYEQCLMHELIRRSIPAVRQVLLPVAFEDLRLENAYRLDLLVADRVIVEVKAVKAFDSLHQAQLLTYLRLSGCRVVATVSGADPFVFFSHFVFFVSCSLASLGRE